MIKKRLLLLSLPLVTALSLQASDPFNDPFFSDPFGDDIFKEMIQMQKEVDKMFERMQHRINQRSSGLVSPLWTYNMSVMNQQQDKGNHYELTTNIPESKENHIDINTANGMMNITAKIVQEKEVKNQYGVSQSRSVRMYQQSFSLPSDADESAIKTTYKGGKLVIIIGKKKSVVAPAKAGTVPTLTKREKDNALKRLSYPNRLMKKAVEKKEQKVTPQKEGNVTIKPMKIQNDIVSMS